jgi:hypothetical protein
MRHGHRPLTQNATAFAADQQSQPAKVRGEGCGKSRVPIMRRAANFARSMTKAARSGFKMCTTAQIAERLTICEACPLLGNGECSECGCPVSGKPSYRNKLALATESCPHPDGPRWGPITETNE